MRIPPAFAAAAAIALLLALFGCLGSRQQIGSPANITAEAWNRISVQPSSAQPGQGVSPDSQVAQGQNPPSRQGTSTRVPALNVSGVPTNWGVEFRHPERLQVYYYYSPLCPFSNRLAPEADAMEKEFANTSEWHRFSVLEPAGYYFFDQMAIRLNLTNSSRVVPIAVVGGKALFGLQEINSTLPAILSAGNS